MGEPSWAWVTGRVLLHHTYLPLFILAGVMHPLAMVALQLLTPKIQKFPMTESSE